MDSRKCIVRTALGAVLMCGTWAAADDLSLTPKYLDDAPAPRKPLMDLLDKAGAAKALDQAGINIYGYVEGSYSHNFSTPSKPFNNPPGFNQNYNNKVLLNQLDLSIERTVDLTKKQWDIGFKVEGQYGSDAAFQHSNGILDNVNSTEGPQNQLDLTQAYVDVAIPVGNGLRLRAGKFVSLLGYETVNPTTNALFSHGYIFNSYNFSNTGVLATYAFTDQITVDAGVTRGLDQSTKDNNGSADGVLRLTYTPNKQWTFYVTTETGPQNADDNAHYRSVWDFIASYAATDRLSFAVDGTYGWDAASDAKEWYGVAGYATYKLDDVFSVSGRAEWFADPNGVKYGLVAANYYELTAGLGIKPFPNDKWGQNLIIRPELRYDWSDQEAYNGKDNQAVAAVDAYFTF